MAQPMKGKARSHADEDVAPPISEDGCFRRGRRWRCRRAYASLWEPHQLDITRLTLALPSLPKAFDGMKVVQFSDLHLGFHTGAKDVARLVQAIQQEKPDMICFTGIWWTAIQRL